MNTMMCLQDAANAVGGTLLGENFSFSSVSTDSRTVHEGQLFIALRGERFDGHAFIGTARERGAVAALVSSNEAVCELQKDFSWIVAKDTREALGRLATCWRKHFSIPVIAVTGSNGKTTTKEMIASILRTVHGENVCMTQGNLNNDIGLPLTLLGLNEDHRAAVIEIGMNHPGEVAALAEIAQPTLAIVTNAQRAHLEGMESLEAIATEKGSIYSGMSESGVAIINADDPYYGLWMRQSAGRPATRFSFERAVEVIGSYSCAQDNVLAIRAGGEQVDVRLATLGKHNAYNALGAAAAAWSVGVNLSSIREGLMAFRGVRRRLQQRSALGGAMLLDDTYNANPDSVRAGIDVLAAMKGKKILVLGDMGEIGKMASQFHEEIGTYAKSKGIAVLLTLGNSSALAVRSFGAGGRHFEEEALLIDVLKRELSPQAWVLVKGSRFMRMERIADAMALPDTDFGERQCCLP